MPSGAWLHLVIGFVLGAIFVIFLIVISKFVRQNKKKVFLLISLGIFVFAVGFLAYVYASLLTGGLLVEWQLLGRPGQHDKAVSIINIGVVEAESGTIYEHSCLGCQDGSWEQLGNIPEDEDEFVILPLSDCGTLSFLPILRRYFVETEEACVSWGVHGAKVVFAIDDGGRVYSWLHGQGEFHGI